MPQMSHGHKKEVSKGQINQGFVMEEALLREMSTSKSCVLQMKAGGGRQVHNGGRRGGQRPLRLLQVHRDRKVPLLCLRPRQGRHHGNTVQGVSCY